MEAKSVSATNDELLSCVRAGAELRTELLMQLSGEELEMKWPRPGLDSFSKHFQEIASVQSAFADAISVGAVGPALGEVPDVFDFSANVTRANLEQLLADADERLAAAVATAAPEATVDWGEAGGALGLPAHLANVATHEAFNHGQMLMAMYVLKIATPAGWAAAWSIPSE
jgi:hypothetical protein